jgi:LPS-assembly protein
VKPFVRTFHLLLALLPAFAAQAQAPELSADEPISYSEQTGMLIAAGNAVYTDENTIVEADEIRYNRESEQIEAAGNVRVTRKGIRLLAEQVHYNARDKTFSANNFRAGYPPLFIEGDSFAGSLEAIDFNDIALYFREPVSSAPRLSIRQGSWQVGQQVTGRGLRLQAFGGLGLPLPGFTYVFGRPTIDVDASLGYRNNLGAYAQSFWLYPFSERLTAGGNLDLYSRRGVLIGPAFNFDDPDGRLRARLNTGWIHDHSFEERATDVLGDPIPQDRGFVDFELAARDADGSLQLHAAATYLGDSETLRDFRQDTYFDRFHPDHYIDFTWQRSSFLLNVFSRAQLNDSYQMIERLPELRAEWLPTELAGTGLFLQASATATRYRLQQPVPGSGSVFLPPAPLGLAGFPQTLAPAPVPGMAPPPGSLQAGEFFERLDGVVTLTRPFAGPAGTQLVLRGGGRFTHYERDAGASGPRAEERWIGELGFDLSQTLARTYAADLPKFNIARLRHQSRLSLQYRWHPHDDRAPVPALFDLYAYHPLPPVLDLADFHHLDATRDWSVARFGWEHELLAADSGGPYRDLLAFSVYQDLNLSADPGADQWEALYARMDFRPLPWLRIQWLQKFRTEDLETEAAFLRATVRSSDLWSLSFQAESLDSAIEQYKLGGWYRLSENVALLGSWQYDARLNSWTQQQYGLSRRFGNVWQLEFYVTLTDQDERRDSFSVGMRLKWLSF